MQGYEFLINAGMAGVFAIFAIVLIVKFLDFLKLQMTEWRLFLEAERTQRNTIMLQSQKDFRELIDRMDKIIDGQTVKRRNTNT